MKRFGPTLLLALPFVVVLVPETMPREVGTLVINCFEYCGRGRGHITASSIDAAHVNTD